MKRTQTFLLTLIFAMGGFISSAQILQTMVSFNGTNGANPAAMLTMGSDGNFYGTTTTGGAYGGGTIFQITTNGALTTLTNFDFYNGFQSKTALTMGNDGNFYGTTGAGGANNAGTVFKVTTNGILTTLFSFTRYDSIIGNYPTAPLTLGSDGNFYGTTSQGGRGGYGTVFKITTNGTLTTLVYFDYTNGDAPNAVTLGNDGNFYGTTYLGESTVFKLTTNDTFTSLSGGATKSSLTLGKDGNFYGTTSGGAGTIFQVATDGSQTGLYSFSGQDGFQPQATVTVGKDGSLYGTTVFGGNYNAGTVFRLLLSPVIIVQPQNQTNLAGTTVTFPINIAGLNPLRYQWQKNGTNLFNGGNVSGVTSNILTIANISVSDEGNYSIIVSNFYDLVTSSNATLTVITPPPTLALQFLAGYPLLSLCGTLGNTYTVEYSTNLAIPNWTPLLIVPNLSISPFQMIDPVGVGQTARFYRAVQLE